MRTEETPLSLVVYHWFLASTVFALLRCSLYILFLPFSCSIRLSVIVLYFVFIVLQLQKKDERLRHAERAAAESARKFEDANNEVFTALICLGVVGYAPIGRHTSMWICLHI